jgi:hypothetical protein
MPKTVMPPPVNADLQVQRAINLANKRLRPPPNYYDASTDMERAISPQTEGAMILMASESKRKAVDYLKAFSGTEASVDDYNELLKVSTDYQIAVSESIMADIQQITGTFQTFRDSILKSGDEDEDIRSGMVTPLAAMVKALGRVGYREARERFHKVFNISAQTQYLMKNGESLKRELRSWVRVFVSYP